MDKIILLADDSSTVLESAAHAFQDSEYTLVQAHGGKDAVERLRSMKPHLVLAAAVMPSPDGYELCHVIKSDPETAHIPVLLTTGTFEPFDIDRAKEVTYDGFVTKPFDAEELLKCVGRQFEGIVITDSAASTDHEEIEAEPLSPVFPETTSEPQADTGNAVIDEKVVEQQTKQPETIIEPKSETPFEPESPLERREDHDTSLPGVSLHQSHAEDEEKPGQPEQEPDSIDSDEISEPLTGNEDLYYFLEKYRKDTDVVPETTGTVLAEDPADETEMETESQEIDEEVESLHDRVSKSDDTVQESETDSEPGIVFGALDDSEDPASTEQLDESWISEIDTVVDDNQTGETEEDPSSTAVETDIVPQTEDPALLDEATIDRIARRVVEHLSETVIREIAWDVVPETAKRLVNQRIGEIEKEAEKES